MFDINEVLIKKETPLKDAFEVIDKSGKQIALVIDKNQKLIGTVTDGDLRRAILKGFTLEEKVEEIMNMNFISLSDKATRKEIIRIFEENKVNQVPLTDENGIVKNLITINEILSSREKKNLVVIMAGGLGERLRPLTEEIPKPLLPIGDKPISEIIIEQFKIFGFYKFVMAVNYKANKIIDYFGDGKELGVEIEYVKEKKRLGTAGALSLLKKEIDEPIFVINGDLLTNLNFESMLKFHNENNFDICLGTREYDFQFPYGVIEMDGNLIKNVVEKPQKKYFINAGVYLLGPQVIKEIPTGEYIDMTELINYLISKEANYKIGAFPIREFWLDIGYKKDYENAKKEAKNVFPTEKG